MILAVGEKPIASERGVGASSAAAERRPDLQDSRSVRPTYEDDSLPQPAKIFALAQVPPAFAYYVKARATGGFAPAHPALTGGFAPRGDIT